MVIFMSTINPAARLYDDMIRILDHLTIKYSSKAELYETFDVRSAAEDYIRSYEKKDNFFTYDDYTEEEYRNIGVEDLGDIITYMNNEDVVPEGIQYLMLEQRRKKVIDEYEELNEYYRMLNGLPPLNTDPKDYIYVDENLCVKYSIPKDIPVHMLEDQLGIYYINILESDGFVDKIIEEHPDYEYLTHLGRRRISVIDARRAKNFEILYLDASNVMESIHREFLRSYSKARDYFVSVCYITEYRNVIQYYDNFIGVCIFLMTMQQVSARMISNAQDREYYDDYSIQLLYETYGVPFNKKIDELTQKQIVQNVNLLVQNKACDKVLLDISSILGFQSIKIYEYYLMKTRQFDANGRPIIKYTEKFNDQTGKYEKVYDYVNMYDLHFQRVPIDEENVFKALEDPSNRVEYLDLTTYDPFWWEDNDTYHNVWETEYNAMETKYLGVTVPYRMTEMLFQSVIQLHMIFDKSEELKDIMIKIPKITTKEVRLFDAIILLCALMAKKNKLKGNIISTPSRILSLLEILDRDINKEVSPDTEILKFDFEAFSRKEIEHIRDLRVEKVVSSLSQEAIDNLALNSFALKFYRENGDFYDKDGIFYKMNGQRDYDIYRDPSNHHYYKHLGAYWYEYDENGKAVSDDIVYPDKIISRYMNGEIVDGNENDLTKEQLYDLYVKGEVELRREYIQDDKDMRSKLVNRLISEMNNVPGIGGNDLYKDGRIITLESSKDFISGDEQTIPICKNIPRKYYATIKYRLYRLLKEDNFYRYFDFEYVGNVTDGKIWDTEIVPDPLIPLSNVTPTEPDYGLDAFSINIVAKSRYDYTRSIIEEFLVERSYRVVNGHDIDLDADGIPNPQSYEKIRTVIDNFYYLNYFYDKLIVLSSESLGVTKEEKVKALNALYENIKELYHFIAYRTSETQDKREYYALKKLYDTIFYAKETNAAFITTDDEGNEQVPSTYLEYLENTDKELYNFVVNIDIDSIYLYIDHIIFHLEDILKHIDQLYILNDEVSPLHELLVQMIEFFKSYTTDMTKLSSYMIMDWKMENILKFTDQIQHMKKVDMVKERFNLQFSDVISRFLIRFTVDDYFKLRDIVGLSVDEEFESRLRLDDERYLNFSNKLITLDINNPFTLHGNTYTDGFFVLMIRLRNTGGDVSKVKYTPVFRPPLTHYVYEGEPLFYFDEDKKQVFLDPPAYHPAITWEEYNSIVLFYFDEKGNHNETLDIDFSYTEKYYVTENFVVTEDGNKQTGFYFDVAGNCFNRNGERVPELDNQFATLVKNGTARAYNYNAETLNLTSYVIKDKDGNPCISDKKILEYKVIDASAPHFEDNVWVIPELWKICKERADIRPKFMGKVIGVNEKMSLYDTVKITYGNEEVYKRSDDSFFRYESGYYYLYDSEKNRISDKEYSQKFINDEIKAGNLTPMEISFETN